MEYDRSTGLAVRERALTISRDCVGIRGLEWAVRGSIPNVLCVVPKVCWGRGRRAVVTRRLDTGKARTGVELSSDDEV